MGYPVVHWELWSRDPAGIGAFYARVFGWDVQAVPDLHYRFVRTGGGGIDGGIAQPKEGPWPGLLTFFIDVDDLERVSRDIVAGGGRMVVERGEIPGMGAYALFADPEGRVLGMWQRTR